MHVVYSFFSFIIESLRLQLAVYRSAKGVLLSDRNDSRQERV